MKKNKIVLIMSIIIIVVLLIIAWFYAGIYGVPWKLSQTKNITKEHMKTKYPHLKYRIGEVGYNFKFGYYFSKITTESDLPITFAVKVSGKNNIKDNYFEQKVNTEAKNMVTLLIKHKMPSIDSIDVRTDALDGKYDKFLTFIPEKSDPLLIDIMYSGENMSLDDFADKVLGVMDILKNKNIPVCGLYIKDKKNGYVFNLKGREVDWKHNFTSEEIIKNKFAYKTDVK